MRFFSGKYGNGKPFHAIREMAIMRYLESLGHALIVEQKTV